MEEENNYNYRFGNRLSGLSVIALGVLALRSDNVFFNLFGAVLATEGAGDLITGYHHYFSTNLLRYLSKGKIDIRYHGDPKFKSEELEKDRTIG